MSFRLFPNQRLDSSFPSVCVDCTSLSFSRSLSVCLSVCLSSRSWRRSSAATWITRRQFAERLSPEMDTAGNSLKIIFLALPTFVSARLTRQGNSVSTEGETSTQDRNVGRWFILFTAKFRRFGGSYLGRFGGLMRIGAGVREGCAKGWGFLIIFFLCLFFINLQSSLKVFEQIIIFFTCYFDATIYEIKKKLKYFVHNIDILKRVLTYNYDIHISQKIGASNFWTGVYTLYSVLWEFILYIIQCIRF